jgi:hypothetical protein
MEKGKKGERRCCEVMRWMREKIKLIFFTRIVGRIKTRVKKGSCPLYDLRISHGYLGEGDPGWFAQEDRDRRHRGVAIG